MKTKGFFFLSIAAVFSVFVMASLPGKKGAGTGNYNSQKRSFQIEEWEKGLNQLQPPIKIMDDIDRSALNHLRRRCKKDGFKNVEIVVGKMENPGFSTGALDVAFMINVYHHLADPVPIIRNIRPSMKPDGILVIVECDPEKVDWGDEHGCSRKEDMIDDLKKAGFEVVRIETLLDEDSIYIAKPIISF